MDSVVSDRLRAEEPLERVVAALDAGVILLDSDRQKAAKFQDGDKKSGGIGTRKHAGPKRTSKPSPQGTKGSQLQRRLQTCVAATLAHVLLAMPGQGFHMLRASKPQQPETQIVPRLGLRVDTDDSSET